MTPRNSFYRFTAFLLVILLAAPAGAILPPRRGPEQRFFTDPALQVRPSLTRLEAGAAAAAHPEIADFLKRHSGSWEVFWDDRSDDPALIQGEGIPLLPGRGNQLRAEDLGPEIEKPISLKGVEKLVRRFLARHPGLFSVPPDELVLDPARSGNSGREHQVWNIELQQFHGGVPVANTGILVRIVHGNIVQIGSDRVAPTEISVEPAISREQAFERALEAAGLAASAEIKLIETPQLEIHPLLPEGEQPGFRYEGPAGKGYRHALLWRLVFQRAGDPTTFQALVNARDGRVLEIKDLNRYIDATVKGGIYPETYLQPEIVAAFPFTQVSDNGTKFTNAQGIYDYTGGSASTQLNGQYFQINDNCGAIDVHSILPGTGHIGLGTSSGTDCTTPGFGGAGNTHASRTSFYALTQINRKSVAFLPGNHWLGTKVTANTNIDKTCNAYWSGGSGTVNFYKSGDGCANTGELSSVVAHEWGHGFDHNTGGGDDGGTKEAVGDIFALLYNRNPCMGPGFHTNGSKCKNCSSCTGVRDLSDFSLDGPRPIASPANVTNSHGMDCGSCPDSDGGVMGYGAHCESYISSTAVFDLAIKLSFARGTEDGWNDLNSLWYDSMTPTKDAYELVSGGQCNPQAVVDGCAATNFYQVFLAMDDDDGNLANGTPDACCIWDALNAHGIACGARPACGSGCQGFGFATDMNGGSRSSNNNVGFDGDAQWMADVNGDGRADYVYNRDNTDEYWVMLANSNGTFQTDKDAGSRNSNNDVGFDGDAQWMADVNGDGRADYVYNRNRTDEYWVMLATSSGTFQTDMDAGSRNSNNDVGFSGDAQWMADVNGDGRADYVYNRNNTKEYWVMLANSNGTFQTDKLAGSRNSNNGVGYSGKAQWLADVNGDGRADYVYNRENTHEYWVMLANADGTFQTDKLAGSRNSNNGVGYSGKAQWLADVNGDGRADYVYNREHTPENWVMLAQSDGTFATDMNAGSRNPNNNVGFSGDAQWMADVNGDGHADYVYNRDNTHEYWIMLGTAAGRFEADKNGGSRNSNNNVGFGGYAQWMADVNGDGRADYVYNRDRTYEYWVMLALGQ